MIRGGKRLIRNGKSRNDGFFQTGKKNLSPRTAPVSHMNKAAKLMLTRHSIYRLTFLVSSTRKSHCRPNVRLKIERKHALVPIVPPLSDCGVFVLLVYRTRSAWPIHISMADLGPAVLVFAIKIFSHTFDTLRFGKESDPRKAYYLLQNSTSHILMKCSSI